MIRTDGLGTVRGVALSLALVVCLAHPIRAASGSDPGDPDLPSLLARLARAAELYRDTALRFECEETIRYWKRRAGRRKHRFDYIYVYSGSGGFEDYRTRPRSESPSREEVDLDDLDIPVLGSAYFWVFVFKQSRQAFHRYEIVGRENVSDRLAVKIRFEPIPPYTEKVNEWFGIAWVDPRTAQLLRVEAHQPRFWRERVAFDDDLANARGKPRSFRKTYEIEWFTTDFDVEENGMRFPGAVRIRRSLMELIGGKRRRNLREQELLDVEQTYRNYKFFRIRTGEEIRGIIFGDEPAPTR